MFLLFFQGIQTELDKLKVEMLQKIEDIHSLECELVKIEDSSNGATSTLKLNRSTTNRNEEVMGEIRNMLKEMISTTSTPNLFTVNNIYEEYSKSVNRRAASSEMRSPGRVKPSLNSGMFVFFVFMKTQSLFV